MKAWLYIAIFFVLILVALAFLYFSPQKGTTGAAVGLAKEEYRECVDRCGKDCRQNSTCIQTCVITACPMKVKQTQ